MSLSASQLACRAEPNDIFYTPADLVTRCLSMLDIGPAETVLDPFAGRDAFYDQLPEGRRDWCEITRGRDFFERTEPVDWCVSNPPFSKITAVLAHSARLCRRGFGYILPFHAITPTRVMACAATGFELTRLSAFSASRTWSIGFIHGFAVFERGGKPLFSWVDKL